MGRKSKWIDFLFPHFFEDLTPLLHDDFLFLLRTLGFGEKRSECRHRKLLRLQTDLPLIFKKLSP
jgi:hypothetical protein